MIHQTHRFHGRKSLGLVFKRGQVMHGRFLSLKFVRNPYGRTYRVAVVVSRKVSKSAVVRNRIRRRIYEAVREVEDQITQPYDLVFLVREDELARIGSNELQTSVHKHLFKAGVLHGSIGSPEHSNHGIVGDKEKNT